MQPFKEPHCRLEANVIGLQEPGGRVKSVGFLFPFDRPSDVLALWCHTFATCGHFGVRRTIDNPQLHTKYICIHSLLNSQSLGVIKRPLSVLSRAGYNFRHHFCFMLRRCSFELLQFVRFEMHNKLRC
jgi:hypothetical protein